MMNRYFAKNMGVNPSEAVWLWAIYLHKVDYF